MANTKKFAEWLSNYNKEELTKHAVEKYQHIAESTHGWASAQKMYILHHALMCMDDDEQYLEIGTYTGRSLVGSLINNDKLAHVIDPFELFLPDGLVIFNHWTETVEKYGVRNRITLHKSLCQNFNDDLPKIGVCYFDGDHDSGHTYEALKKFEKYLADDAIVICDDYKLFGGSIQKPYPGHKYILDFPVKHDVDRWLNENPRYKMIDILGWENHSAVIIYRR